MKTINFNLEKLVPPGTDPKNQMQFFITANIISLFFSLLFFVRYANRYQDLLDYDGCIIEGKLMPDFPLILDKFTVGFALVAVCMMFYVIYHYGSYVNGSMSLYLMKRLPNGFEMHKRAWALPLLTAGLSLAIGFLTSIFYLCFYIIFTPHECLAPDQWQKFWSFFSYFI